MSAIDLARSMARANPRWSRTSGARNQCEQASYRFAMFLEGHGIQARVLACEEPAHVAVLADGVVVDLTARQFTADAPYPLITSEGEWRSWLAGLRVGASPTDPVVA